MIHSSAMLADAWATTLTVLGFKRGLAFANQHGIAARVIAETAEHLSLALKAMLEA